MCQELNSFGKSASQSPVADLTARKSGTCRPAQSGDSAWANCAGVTRLLIGWCGRRAANAGATAPALADEVRRDVPEGGP